MPITDEDARRIAKAHTEEKARAGCMGCLLPVVASAVLATGFVFPLSLLITLPLAFYVMRAMNRSLGGD